MNLLLIKNSKRLTSGTMRMYIDNNFSAAWFIWHQLFGISTNNAIKDNQFRDYALN